MVIRVCVCVYVGVGEGCVSICTHVEVTHCCQMSSFVAFNFILFHFEVRSLIEPGDGCLVRFVDW